MGLEGVDAGGGAASLAPNAGTDGLRSRDVSAASSDAASSRAASSDAASSGAGSSGATSSGASSSDSVSGPLDPALSHVPRTFYQRAGKRLFDLVAGSVLLLLISPALLLLTLAIKLDSPGPVLYVSTRLGRRARPFRFLKFRSMYAGADRLKSQLSHLNEMDGPVFKIREDPRVTRVGRFLRKTSLDELPQLISVVIGDMSLVGPRPPIPEEVAQYELWQRRRLSVTPGITCLWQVSGRNQIGFNEWMRLDMEYIDHLCFPMDLRILLLTVPAVVKGGRGGAS